MELSAVADDLNEVSVLVNVAHRLLLAIRDDVEASASLQAILDDLNTAHDQLDQVLETIGSAIDQADAEANRQPREQRPAIH
jgi:ABC-type transporter Mla subunit MlaD